MAKRDSGRIGKSVLVLSILVAASIWLNVLWALVRTI
jgi:hypothetical protein